MRPSAGRALIALLAIQALTACSLDRSALVPASFTMRSRHPGSVTILVAGGDEAIFLDPLWVSSEVFSQALEDAVTKSGLFARVVPPSEAAFRIDVALQRLTRPGGDTTAEAQLSALWVLRALNPDRIVWQDLIVTSGVSTMSDALLALRRMRMSIERATSKNIQRAIQEMSLVDLSSGRK